MPVQQGKVQGVLASLGKEFAQALENNKSADTAGTFNSGLPGGIEGGVAQIVSVRFDVFKDGENKGKAAFFLQGIAALPKEHNGTPVAGKRVMVSEPIFATPNRKRKTVGEHAEFIQAIVKELLGPNFKPELVTASNIESACQFITKAKPFFYFSTFLGQKQTTGPYANREPRVNTMFQGAKGLENFRLNGDSNPATSAIVDDSPVDDDDAGGDDQDDVDSAPVAEQGGNADADGGLEELANIADDSTDDDAVAEAEEKLIAFADQAGVSEAERKKAKNWAAVVALINAKNTPAPAPAASDNGADFVPTKGEVYGFKVGGKGKKIRVSITSVSKKNKTVDLLNAADKTTTYEDVAWDDLLDAD